MTTAVRPRRTKKPTRNRPPTDGWWGDGPAPWERWPGVTIPLESVWTGERWESPDGRFYYDQDEADKAVDFFPTFLKHHIGEFAGRPFSLMPYQEYLLTRPIFGWRHVDSGVRRFRRVFAFLPKGAGKALALDTPIPTPSGWSTMGALDVGDSLFDEHGDVCHVVGTSEVMTGRPCYRVTFSDGSSIVADAEHMWQTTAQRNGKPRHLRSKFDPTPRLGEPSLVTTEEIARTLRPPPTTSIHPQAKWNHRIDVAGPLRTEGVALPIPPYTLGAWLGDGDSDCARLTMAFADAGISEAIASEGIEVRQQRRHSETTGRFSLGAGPRGGDASTRTESLTYKLRALGLLGNKRIPPVYLRASIEQRLALLQGLMDTDGYVSQKGRAEFSVVRKELADDVCELLVSLGYKVRVREGQAALGGRVIGKKYRIAFTPTSDRPVFRLARKLNRVRPAPKTRRLSESRRIVGCDLVESVPVKCIRVDSPSRLFLAGESMVPTHNSPWGAGTGLYLTLCDNEPGAEVYAVAGDTKQARVVHDNARIMVEESDDLLEMCEVLRDAIYHAGSRSTYKVLSSDAGTKHGFRPHGIVFDEIHNQKDRNLFEALTKSMKKRRQPLLLIITHAGEDDEGIAYEEYEYAKRVLSGTVDDDTALPVIFEATNDEPWDSEVTWRRVNPGHGITVQHSAIVSECEQAKAQPRRLNDFRRYTLNQWVNAASAWMPVEWWDACKTTVDESALQQLSVAAGLDMAQKNDLTALVLTFKEPLEESTESVEVVGTNEFGDAVKRSISLNYRITTVPFFWIPADTMREHEKTDRVPYAEWARLGLVRATEGNVIDYDRIFRDIVGEIVQRFPRLKCAEIGYDPAFATDLALRLQAEGFRMVEVLQNYKHLSEPAMTFEALVKGKRVRHGGHRVLRWNVENCSIKSDDAGRIRPVKPKRATKRIDGVVASLMGVSRLMVQESEPEPSLSFLSFGR